MDGRCRRPLVIFEAPPGTSIGDSTTPRSAVGSEQDAPDVEAGHAHGMDSQTTAAEGAGAPIGAPTGGVGSPGESVHSEWSADAAAEAAAAVTAHFMERHWQHLEPPAPGVHDNRWLLSVRQPILPTPRRVLVLPTSLPVGPLY